MLSLMFGVRISSNRMPNHVKMRLEHDGKYFVLNYLDLCKNQ